MPDQRELAFNFIKANGPVIPVQVSKILNTNILFASAVLSELVERKTLKMTSASIGGSKVYYIPNLQEPLLGDKLYHALNPVEKEIFTILKEKKVLRDKELEPKHRIALRDLKDFAVPLTVTLGEESEIFWKFHIMKDDEARTYIQQYIEEAPEQKKQEPLKPADIPENQAVHSAEQMSEVVARLKEELMKELKEAGEKSAELQKRQKKDALKEQLKERAVEEQKEKIHELPKETKEEDSDFLDKGAAKKPEGKFYREIVEFFNSSNIKVIKEEMIKKEKEYDFIVKVPTAFGIVHHYVKARDKKIFNDADLSLAYSAGKLKNLPTIVLGKGKLNKKAALLLADKLAGQLVFKEL